MLTLKNTSVGFLKKQQHGCANICPMKNEATHSNILNNLPRGRHGLSRELVRASQRMRLLDAMAELMAEKGYAHVTIADIVGRGGVAKRTFYEYFADKEAGFQAVGEYLASKIAEAIVLTHDPSMNLYARTEATIRGMLQVLQDHPTYARACFLDVWAAGAKTVELRLNVNRELAQLLVFLSQDIARHQSSVQAISDVHASAVITAIDGYLFRVIYTEGAEQITRHVETLAQLATGFLKADMSRLKPLQSV